MQLWVFGEPEVAVIQVSVSTAQSVLHHHELRQSLWGVFKKTEKMLWVVFKAQGRKKKKTKIMWKLCPFPGIAAPTLLRLNFSTTLNRWHVICESWLKNIQLHGHADLLAKSFGLNFSSKKIRPKIELAENTKKRTRWDLERNNRV